MLQADLKGGKTLAQEATAKGKTAAGLITALTDGGEGQPRRGSGGRLADAEAGRRGARGRHAEITELVNNGPPVPHAKKCRPARRGGDLSRHDGCRPQDGAQGRQDARPGRDGQAKTVDGLVAALTADAKTKLDKAVADNAITQAQATAILNRLTAQVTDFVNGVHGPKATTTTTNAIKHALKYTVRR